MKTVRATSASLSRAVLAAAIAIVLSSPVYATDPLRTSGAAAADRSATSDLRPADNSMYDEGDEGGDSLTPRDETRTAASELKRADNRMYNESDEDGYTLTPLDEFDDGAAADRTASSDRKPADNSTHNDRDQDGDNLTPLNQSHAAADVELTRSIREELVDDDALGTNAQNIKVITIDGVVTLRGVVKTDEEHTRILAIATKAAGADYVVDELEVIEG